VATVSRFAAGHGTGDTWEDALERCCRMLGHGSGHGGALGIAFISDDVAPHAAAVIDRLGARTGCRDWIGTVGIGVCAAGVEYYGRPAVTAMVCDLPPDSFRLIAVGDDDERMAPRAHEEWLGRQASTVSFVHCDPRTPNLPARLEQLTRDLGETYVVGGIASSRGGYVQFAGSDRSSPVSGAVISDRVAVATRLTQGCSPIGPAHRVTGMHRGAILAIDEQPAIEVLKADIGEVLSRNLEQIGGYIFAGLPIAGSDTGDYLVRNIAGIAPEHGALLVAGQLHEGDRIMFCRRDPQTALADLDRMLEAIRPPDGRVPRGAVYYDCLARGAAQFGSDSRELKRIRERLGEVPLVGFFGNGEIANARLYAYTGVLTLFL
jgi:small ligand-binding sensory domain FIST